MWKKLVRSVALVSIPGILLLVPTALVLAPVKPLAVLTYIVICIFLVLAILSLVVCAVVDPGIIPGRELQEYYLNQLYEIITKKQRTLYQGRQSSAYGSPEQQKTLTIQEKLQLKLNLTKSIGSEKQISPAQDVEKFIHKDPRSLFKNSRAYQILDSIHHVDRPLIFFEKGFKYTPKYCPTCRFYRPIRSSHSSKSNVCIQRYDHFCEWIGTDVGLHNHGIFYIMLLILMVYSILSILFGFICMIVSIVIPASCKLSKGAFQTVSRASICQNLSYQINGIVDMSVALNFVAFALSIGIICASSYIFYSLHDLAHFHHILLKTGALTKEDIGGGTLAVTAPYSLGSVWQNLKLSFRGLKQPRVLHLFIKRQEQLLALAKSSQFVNSFDALGRVLRLNGVTGFENIDEAVDPAEDELQRTIRNGTGMKKSIRESLTNDPEDSQQPPQTIAENITVKQIMTARDSFEFAIKQARQMVQITAADFTKLRTEKPELFEPKTEEHQLQLTNMCKKKEKSKKIKDVGDVDVSKGKNYEEKKNGQLPPMPITSALTGATGVQPAFI